MWRVITEKWDATSRAAGKPATAPSAAETTGAVAIASMIERKRGGENTGSPAGREPLPPVPVTLPPAPSRKRTSGRR